MTTESVRNSLTSLSMQDEATEILNEIMSRNEKMLKDGKKAWPAKDIRSAFINFFIARHEHVFWRSSPCVPHDDPTLLFANAGMNQYKPLFLGQCDPSDQMYGMTRACNTQKCIRAGGKHNDLEDVGKDVYHHTFFEMMGNWSFGSYFKEEAIAWAWECLIDVYKLDPNRLYATYFGGDASQGLESDEEAREIWLKYLPAEKVLPFDCKDNFWEMGDTGPCGPCTEIHYDRIGNRDAAHLVNADVPDVIEIWNNVFIQFNREADRSLRELPAKHVDTGMGFERLASILQGVDSNYDTDVFIPLFQAIQAATGARDYTGKIEDEDVDGVDMAYRVIADHIRTLTFAITDGAFPSNSDRGYVLRHILRRAVRYGQQVLGGQPGFFSGLTHTLVEQMKEAFPELVSKKELVISVIADEERAFNKTLDKGLKYFNKIVEKCKEENTKVISGKDTHFLYATMGFPCELTEVMAEEKGFTVDMDGYKKKMELDKKLSEVAAKMKKGEIDLKLEAEQTAFLINKNTPTTNSESKYTWDIAPTAKITGIYVGKSESNPVGFVDEVTQDCEVFGVVLDTTSYYYESGGQIYDTGLITNSSGTVLSVQTVKSYGGFVLHLGALNGDGKLAVGDSVTLEVDYQRRAAVAPNHTMTHVLNYALRAVLLGGVASDSGMCDQKGSDVDDNRLRFDFSWNEGLTVDQLAQIETICNEQISKKYPVYAETVPLEDASRIQALRSVFGERYPNPVRVISVGQEIQPMLADPENPAWMNFSVEFCGGTHLDNLDRAKKLLIVEESGIAKGVRRILAVTKDGASDAENIATNFEMKLKSVSALPVEELSTALKELTMEHAALKCSVVMKAQFKTSIELLGKKRSAHIKELQKAEVDVCKAAVTKAAADGVNKVVMVAKIGTDAKLAAKILKDLQKINPIGSFIIISGDEDTDRIGAWSAVSKEDIKAGISAKTWTSDAMIVAGGGKGGGKDANANSNATGFASIAAVEKAAQAYISSK